MNSPGTKNESENPVEPVEVVRALRLMREARVAVRSQDVDGRDDDDDDEIPIGAFLVPIQMKDFEDIKKEAINRYHISQKRDVLKGGKNVGKPRVMYTQLINEVKTLENDRKARIVQKAKERQEKLEALELQRQIAAQMANERGQIPKDDENNGKSGILLQDDYNENNNNNNNNDDDDDDIDELEEEDMLEEMADSIIKEDTEGRHLRKMLRLQSLTPHNAPKLSDIQKEMKNGNDDDDDDDDDDDEEGRFKRQSSRRRSSVAAFGVPVDPLDEKRHIKGGALPPKRDERSKSNLDIKIEEALLRRKSLSAEKEMSTLARIKEKEDRIKQRQKAAAREHLLVSWLFIVAQSSRLSKMAAPVIALRKERLKWLSASKEKKAVRTIELWWPPRLLELKIKRNSEKMMHLRVACLHLNCKIQRRKRNAGMNLVQQFIRDCTGMGETVQKLYSFRGKILLIQAWVRSFLACKQSRMMNLILYMDRKEEEFREKFMRAEELDLERSREAAERIRGFGDTIRKIDYVRDAVNNLHEKESEKNKWRSQGDNKKKGFQNAVTMPAPSMMDWVQRVKKHHPGGDEKLRRAMFLVTDCRKRHIIAQDASMMPTEDRKPVQLNIKDALALLKDGAEGGLDLVTQKLDPDAKAMKRGPFLLLTGQGRHSMDKIDAWMHKRIAGEFGYVKGKKSRPGTADHINNNSGSHANNSVSYNPLTGGVTSHSKETSK